MAWLIILAIFALPVAEIALFVKMIQWVGLLPTILLAVLSGVAGLALLRGQGLAILWRSRAKLQQAPLAEAFDGICLALAGFLLLLPGFLSDAIALLLLFPPVRAGLLAFWVAHLGRAMARSSAYRPRETRDADPFAPSQPHHPQKGTIIDGDYQVIEPDRGRPDQK